MDRAVRPFGTAVAGARPALSVPGSQADAGLGVLCGILSNCTVGSNELVHG